MPEPNNPPEPIIIPFDEYKVAFEGHLKPEDNFRLIFSGAFGCGKTTFLNELFNNHDEYDVIRLFPVNYVIAQTEDIFELLKFDILFELLAKADLFIDQEEFSQWLTGQVYFQDKAYDILKPILEKTSKIGKTITTVIDPLIDLVKNYNSFHKSMQIDEKQDAINYLKSFQQKKGSIYEFDAITNIIYKANEGRKDKKNVLIIDDMDRVDPEHIFRILNIFSAHLDQTPGGNKFGFDKIILVCDVRNIRQIFHAKYGVHVDFSGYIDKFYSKRIFHFEPSTAILGFIKKFIDAGIYDRDANAIFGMKRKNIVYNFLCAVVGELAVHGLINLRKLKQMEGSVYELGKSGVDNKNGDLHVRMDLFPVVALVKYWADLLGSFDDLKEAVLALKDYRSKLDRYPKNYICLLLPFLLIEHVDNKSEPEAGHLYKYPGTELSINFKVQFESGDGDYYNALVTSETDFSKINVLALLYEVLLKIERRKLF